MKNITNIAIWVLLLSGTIVQAQKVDSTEFMGFFNGINLNIQCQESIVTPWKTCDCIDSVAVNGNVVDNILYEGYQVDLANAIELNLYDTVRIVLYHLKKCRIRTLNPYDFFPKTILPVAYLKLEKDNMLTWAVQENYPDLKLWVQIEQYKWGEWIKIGHVNITDQVVYQMDVSTYLNRGENKFRASIASIEQDHVPGDEITVKHKCRKVKFKINKKAQKIVFSRKTHYEVWNKDWQIAARGYDDEIDYSKYKEGEYYLRYAGEEKLIELQKP
ncbi:MAG: hypothetical protein HUJ25_14845 [Crocinitomicaceae bacterium]|nr:hypothetical protein [Crocinitomicaceae bacterium]